MHAGFLWGNLTGVHFGNHGIDWRIILRSVFKKWGGGMYWIDLAQESDW
jgi:hypothetical protein